MFRSPAALQKGDQVAIIPPAKAIDPGYVSDATGILESWGLKVIRSENIGSRHFQYAGRDEERLSSFQTLLDSSQVKGIFSARGGYGTTRIIDRLDFSKFQQQPKWIIGYSDLTSLLLRLIKMGIRGIHGPMPINFNDPGADESLRRLQKLLFTGNTEPVVLPGDRQNRPGETSGRLIGGNLSLLVNCIGTPDDFSTDNCLLFIEDVDEYYYRIDRMMVQLKRAGKLNRLSGLVVGHFTRLQNNDSPFGAGIREIVLDHVGEYDYPVCFGAPFGHEMPNFPITVGGNFTLRVSTREVVLEEVRNEIS